MNAFLALMFAPAAAAMLVGAVLQVRAELAGPAKSNL